MATRAGMSEVKFKVRSSALLLCEFTVEQMVRSTGLKPESVRTELQRMKQESLLEVTRSTAPTDQKRKRGGQNALYRLVSDPEKRLALSRSIETFYPEKPRSTLPTSRHYQIAVRQLDRASEAEDGAVRESLLSEAEEELDFALSEEGASRAPEPVRAHIELQRGRLFYLRGDDGLAAPIFLRAREALNTTGQLGEVVQVNKFLICIEARRRWNAARDYRPEKLAHHLLQTMRLFGLQINDALTQMMADLLCQLSYTPQDRIVTIVTDANAARLRTMPVGDILVLPAPQQPFGVHEIPGYPDLQQMPDLNSTTYPPSLSNEDIARLFQPPSPGSKLP